MAAARVMVFGIDAGNRDLLQHWAEDSSLPTLQSLIQQGTSVPIRNDPGLYVGSVWPSFATGLTASGHGRYCYRQLVPGSYESPRYHINALKDEPFWEVASRQGRRVAIIDVPKTPLSKNLNGVHVVDWGTHDPDYGFATWPPGLATEILNNYGADPLNGRCDADRCNSEEFAELRDLLVARIQHRLQLARQLLKRGPWDLFIVCFPESHCAGHQFWHLHDSTHNRHSAELARKLGDPLKAVYAEIDSAIGKLTEEAAQPEFTLVLSSHGMENHYTGTPLLEEILRRLHYTNKEIPRKGWAHLLMRWWVKLPGKLRLRLKPLREQLERFLGVVEPSLGGAKVQHCFQIPNNDAYGAIRINLVGREPNGQINPGLEFQSYCVQLKSDLLALVNEETNKPVVKNIWFADELYQGKNRDCLPDVIVEWNKVAPINSITSPKTGRVSRIQTGNRTGDHRNGGILWAAGNGIPEGIIGEEASMVDVGPTICQFLEVPFIGRDGKPISVLASGLKVG